MLIEAQELNASPLSVASTFILIRVELIILFFGLSLPSDFYDLVISHQFIVLSTYFDLTIHLS